MTETFRFRNYPKNHGISSAWWFGGDPERNLLYTSKPLFFAGSPVILRVVDFRCFHFLHNMLFGVMFALQEIFQVYDALSKIPNGFFTVAAAFGNVHGVYQPGNVKLEPTILDKVRIIRDESPRISAT